jgi:hypothetical protein
MFFLRLRQKITVNNIFFLYQLSGFRRGERSQASRIRKSRQNFGGNVETAEQVQPRSRKRTQRNREGRETEAQTDRKAQGRRREVGVENRWSRPSKNDAEMEG